MLDKISEFAEEIIISTGMSSYDEIDKCFNSIKPTKKTYPDAMYFRLSS